MCGELIFGRFFLWIMCNQRSFTPSQSFTLENMMVLLYIYRNSVMGSLIWHHTDTKMKKKLGDSLEEKEQVLLKCVN